MIDNNATSAGAEDKPAESFCSEGLVSSGVLTGYVVQPSCFIPTSHMRIARHSGKWLEGSFGGPIDRLQQAWVDQYDHRKVEWRDIPIELFDVMPENPSKI